MMSASMPVYELKELTKYYGQRRVLDIPSLTFEEGEIYALVGPNGSGKTTLMSILALLETPTAGRLLYRMKEVHPRSPLPVKREITMVSQNPVMLTTSVFSNVAYGLKARGFRKDELKPRVEEALHKVGLGSFGKRSARKLSSGEAQRVAIARALAVSPCVLLLDEPTSNVDPMNAEIIEGLIRNLREDDVTVIMSTHNLSQAYRLADNVITLLDGRVSDTFKENLFKACIYKEDGESLARVGNNSISLVTDRAGEAYISIDPRDIIVSLEEIHSSARNNLRGTIIRIEDTGKAVMLGVEAGAEYNVQITHASFRELGLTLGTPVYLTFKSSAVSIF